MKLLKTGIICLLVNLCATCAFAQPNIPGKDAAARKPELFHDLPRRMNMNAHLFEPLLQKEIGETVNIPLADDFVFQGVVVSKSDASEVRSKTVVIRSSNRSGAALTITGIRNADGSYRYNGRLLSLKYRDAYEMVETDGRFALEKKELSDLVTE
jgi:hypothetical protein